MAAATVAAVDTDQRQRAEAHHDDGMLEQAGAASGAANALPLWCANHTLFSRAETLLDYRYLVSCTPLQQSLVLSHTLLVVLLILLLYLLSSTADSFFCPSLQAIVERYRIPPDIAGVTFLSFGNGSPDVFSNIAAFASSTPKIGVTSILGGGLLVTTVITASVGLASQGQQQLIPRKYVRDVVFYLIGVAYFCFVFFDGKVHVWKALGFIVLYILYVIVVFSDRHLAAWLHSKDFVDEFDDLLKNDIHQTVYYSSSSRSNSEQSLSELEDIASGPLIGTSAFKKVHDIHRIPRHRFYPPSSDSEQSDAGDILQRIGSDPTLRSFRSRVGELECGTREERLTLLQRTDSVLRRPASVCTSAIPRRRRRKSAWESVESSADYSHTARRWTRSYHLSGIAEFPAVSEGGEEPISEEEVEDQQSSSFIKEEPEPESGAPWTAHVEYRWRKWYRLFMTYIWHPFEFATTFLRRLTIPLVDEETWNKNFAMVCPFFSVCMIATAIFRVEDLSVTFLAVLVLVGGLGAAFVEYTAHPFTPPEGCLLAPYLCLAFVMSVTWIMTIADEVLGVLEVLGQLFGIPNSVLGVSVLAWGNSIGDLVSNTSIARDGFPTMAFAGCFAGPMFNLLIGIGASLLIAAIKNGPVSMGNPSPLVYLGFAYLAASLLINVGVVAFCRFEYRRGLCYALYALYASFAVISIVVVIYTS
ncbi:TPA: hypothetical protein N0F65_010370 [Lagenidium giganteum]|uniref:Sodium/calcium exchanger membrane region domain-containing protein n=1 Tax=Lagenidium giganteum TaxID=4803 RepID=A0AAV2YJ44_9STRA|nr:TPA: hypothetical protein N0F65_010370 [Lagenidium giganteum]